MNAWRNVSLDNIKHSIDSAGFSDDMNNWHIAKHDVYGRQFKRVWNDRRLTDDVNFHHFEETPQDDDVHSIVDDMNDLDIEYAEV